MNETPVKICQSCSMPMTVTEHFGTNSNGSPNTDYCCFCFQDGNFTHNLSMEETIETPAFIRIEPEIREIKSKQVITVRVVNPFVNTGAFIHAWKKLIRFAGINGIPDNEHEYFTLSRDISTITRPDLYRSYACVTANPGIKPRGEFGEQTIDGGLYAVFAYKGAYRNLERIYCFIYRNWIPNSKYELRDIAFFEKFLNSPDVVKQDDLLTEIYIPVKRKQRTVRRDNNNKIRKKKQWTLNYENGMKRTWKV